MIHLISWPTNVISLVSYDIIILNPPFAIVVSYPTSIQAMQDYESLVSKQNKNKNKNTSFEKVPCNQLCSYVYPSKMSESFD